MLPAVADERALRAEDVSREPAVDRQGFLMETALPLFLMVAFEQLTQGHSENTTFVRNMTEHFLGNVTGNVTGYNGTDSNATLRDVLPTTTLSPLGFEEPSSFFKIGRAHV